MKLNFFGRIGEICICIYIHICVCVILREKERDFKHNSYLSYFFIKLFLFSLSKLHNLEAAFLLHNFPFLTYLIVDAGMK